MQLTLYQIDAFTDQLFRGNPAAVCPLTHWLPDPLLQSIADENNLSETAFFVPIPNTPGQYALRWFTPTSEVDLCGHATLATAFALYDQLASQAPNLHFETRSGRLTVTRVPDAEAQNQARQFRMTLPATIPQPCPPPPALVQALGAPPQACLSGRKYMAVYATAAQVRALTPDFSLLKTLDLPGVIATAPGSSSGLHTNAPDTSDFVSRFFAPKLGIDEDPVTGSAHSELTPYWAQRLGKQKLTAHQISRRGGRLICELTGHPQAPQVALTGSAVLYMTAQITLPNN